jgi:hypothetical protein
MATPEPAANTPTKTGPLKSIEIGCGGLIAAFILSIGVFVLSAVIAGIAGADNSPRTTTAVGPSPFSKPSATASNKLSSSAKPSVAPAAAAAHCGTTSTAAARSKAAGILHANHAYYQTEFNDGATVTLNRGSDNSFPPFHAWQQKAATDVQPGMDVSKQADACFTAATEPQSISDWRDDNGNLSADVAQLGNAGLDVGGPYDAQTRQKVLADASMFPYGFQTAETDADNVAAGK